MQLEKIERNATIKLTDDEINSITNALLQYCETDLSSKLIKQMHRNLFESFRDLNETMNGE
jgi:hypothetical protein